MTSGAELQFDPALKELMLRAGGSHMGQGLSSARAGLPVNVVAKLHNPSRAVPGMTVVSCFGDVVTARVPMGMLVDVRSDSNVASLKASGTYVADLAFSVPAIGADTSTLRRIVPEGVTGKGTAIAVIDWGFDFAHSDLLNTKGKSRILYLWDQRGGSHDRSPKPYGYGREYDQSAIDTSLSTPDPYLSLGYDPATMETGAEGAHGTHVAAIAAGSGLAKGSSPGVAPGADLILVHLCGDDTSPKDTFGDSVRLLEAVDYVVQRAGDRHLAINLSVGRTGDSKDGTSPVEQALDYVSTSAPGRVVCMSTGNYFRSRLHASGCLKQGQHTVLRWRVPPHRLRPAELEIWYGHDDELLLELDPPGISGSISVPLGSSRVLRSREGITASIYHRRDDPNNGDHLINIFLHPAAAAGEWRIGLGGIVIEDGRFHAWIERESRRYQSRFHRDDADPLFSIGTLAAGRRTIACAAFDARGGGDRIAPFSSGGPTRDGRDVPVLAAPGVAIRAACSTYLDGLGFRVRNQLVSKSGTSMAAPHVAGTAALMMEAAKRPLFASEIREILTATARAPPRGEGRNCRYRCGAGLLDAERAVQFAAECGFGRWSEAAGRGNPPISPSIRTLEHYEKRRLRRLMEQEEYVPDWLVGDKNGRKKIVKTNGHERQNALGIPNTGGTVMETLPRQDMDRLAGALRQLTREIVHAVGDAEYEGDPEEGYFDERGSAPYVEAGEEIGEGADEIMGDDEFERLERIIGVNNLLPAHFLEEGASVQRSVARIVLPTGSATGFMVARTLMLTNNHVLRNASDAGRARAEFNYQLDVNGNPRTPEPYRFDPGSVFYTNQALDFSLVRVSPRASTHAGDRWGSLALRRTVSYHARQHLNIIQHPRGRRKECALQENRVTHIHQNTVRYTTDTEQGSSGSPVFNNAWDLVALHHSGGDRRGTVWINNEGIRVDQIVAELRRHFSSTSGGAAVLQELGI